MSSVLRVSVLPWPKVLPSAESTHEALYKTGLSEGERERERKEIYCWEYTKVHADVLNSFLLRSHACRDQHSLVLPCRICLYVYVYSNTYIAHKEIYINSSLPILHFGGARRCGGCPLLSRKHHVRAQRRRAALNAAWGPGTCSHMTSCIRSWASCVIHVTSRAQTANCRVYRAIAGHPPRHVSLGE